MDGAQVSVLKQANQVRLGSLLKGKDSRALKAQVRLEILGDLANQALEGQLADQQLRTLLVATDLTKSHGARAVAVRLLHTTRGGGALTGSLGGQLLAGGLASGGLACGLLGSCHVDEIWFLDNRIGGNKTTLHLLWHSL